MSQRTIKRLKQLCYATSFGNDASAESRYQTLKRNWDKTPAPARHKLMKALEKGAAAMAAFQQKMEDTKDDAVALGAAFHELQETLIQAPASASSMSA